MPTKVLDVTPNMTPLILRAIHLADEQLRPDAGRELVVECLRYALRLDAAAREQRTS